MKNKLLYGLLGAGALAGVYFYQKRNKETTLPLSNEDLDNTKPAPSSVFSSEEVENLSKQFADETIAVAKKELERLQFEPVLVTDGTDKKIIKKPQSSIFGLSKQGVLLESIKNFQFGGQKESIIIMQNLNTITKSYGNLYKMYKKSIPNFDSMTDLVLAKDLLIKILVFGDQFTPTKEEQIFMANEGGKSNKAIMMFPETFGFDIQLLNLFGGQKLKQAIGTK
jgi:hypothetical protein